VRARRIGPALLAGLLLAASARADTVTLTNGRVIEADRAWFEGNQLLYEKAGARYGLPRSLVRSLQQKAAPGAAPAVELPDAAAALQAGRPADAVRLAQEVLAREPRSVAALLVLAEAQLRQGQSRPAREAAERVLRLDDRDARAHALLGEALAAQGNPEGAIEAFRASLRLRPDEEVQRRIEDLSPAPVTASGPRFRLRFDGSINEPLGLAVLEALGSAFDDYRARLGVAPEHSITVTLETEAEFQDARTPTWAQGLNDGSIRVAVRGLAQLTPRLRSVLRHELAHSFLAARTRGNCPTWLHEGVAQWLEGGDPEREDASLAAQARAGRLRALASLEGPFQGQGSAEATLAYAESLSAVTHILRLRGQAGIVRLLSALADGMPAEEALPAAIGLSYPELERSWQEALRSRH
jgi:tetratricopeptide (TPR) repeat protein